MYEKFFKRFLDMVLSFLALVVLSPVLVMLTVIGAFAMKGNPIFTQLRPGMIDKKTGREKIFKLVKFRSMTCEKDKNGKLLPDDKRLTKYGKMLRATSLDELPELWNILKGDMSIIGPRPQLVRDMVFMTEEQRKRHSVRQGLTGLAQVSGRNNMTWEKKFEYDLEYIENITFKKDLKILFMTVGKVFIQDGVSSDGMETAQDFGDYLLSNGSVDDKEYLEKMALAKELMKV